MKKAVTVFLCIVLMLGAVACGQQEADADLVGNAGNLWDGAEMEAPEDGETPMDGGWFAVTDVNGNLTTVFRENSFISTEKEAVSTFSADVDTASYAYFRKLVNAGYSLEELIETAGASIRTEEMVNYFDYSYNAPREGDLFGTSVQMAPCPWNDNSVLMVLGLQTEQVDPELPNNLVFLIDVSGSMSAADKLPLLKNAFSQLTDQLDANDTVSIVTYSGAEKVVLEGCAGSKSEQILQAVNDLKASGSTNGQAGLQMAYTIAERYFVENGNNRIIMASDGDLNVGISSEEELERFISEKKESGVYLSVLGFGTGNYKDSKMETLADHGNGIYYYIDGESEAERVFGTDLLSTLYTVGTDVKLQLTFDTKTVDSYRLVGYENRLLNKEDFDDDTKDAGEVGCGHSVTVCYELILKDGAMAEGSHWMDLAVRYKKVGESESTLEEYALGRQYYTEAPNEEFRFISLVVQTAMVLHRSEYAKDITVSAIVEELQELTLMSDPPKQEFLTLLQKLAP